MVTPEPPVKTVKKAQTTAVTTAVPPGIQPKMARKTSTRRCEALPSASRKPVRVKSGMAGRVGETERR